MFVWPKPRSPKLFKTEFDLKVQLQPHDKKSIISVPLGTLDITYPFRYF